MWSIPFKYPLPFPPHYPHYGQDFLMGGGGALKVISEGIDCDVTFDLWNISEGCRKNWLFLWGGGRGTVSVPLIFFSFLLELIRDSDLAFQKQHKGTSVYGV